MTGQQNLFAGSPLNRLSWLRTSHVFLNAAITLPATRWLLFLHGQPLIVKTSSDLAYLSTEEVRPLLGPEPFFGQGKNEGELVTNVGEDAHASTHAARLRNSPVVFLGVHEDPSHGICTLSNSVDADTVKSSLRGVPYFAMEIADEAFALQQLRKFIDPSLSSLGKSGTMEWSDPRMLITKLDYFSGAVYAEARSMVDWNYRNKFCPACGSRSYSLWGGWKIACTSLLPWADNIGRKPCPTRKGLHNFTHPRTDAVVIMIAIDESGERILLGRGKKFPGKYYSAIAGFIEPGECLEDAVIREMWEETGITVWDVKYHSGQPWPYPANLMIGFYARADHSQPIRVDLDNELTDAHWFTRSEIMSVLQKQVEFSGSDENKKTNENNCATKGKPLEAETFKLPPTTAIAGMLIRDWLDGKIGYPSYALSKGSL